MSTSIDNRVVQMEFDNAQFEQGVSQSLQTLTRLDAALNDLENAGGFQGLSASISSIGDDFENTFSFRGVAALTTFQRIASSVVDTVVGIFSRLKSNYMPVNFIDQIITGGTSRAKNIEDAKFRLKGLGVAWEEVEDDINYAVKDTAYGLDAAGKAASQLAASGMEFGSDVENGVISPMGKALRGISGVAAMTNSTYDDIANIFTTISGNGKMMTKELRMMAYRGLNVAATMADQFNQVLSGSPEALDKYSDSALKAIYELNNGAMISEQFIRDNMKDGIITSELFFEAMDAAYGEHAKKANETYAGSLDNVRAALSRIGAAYQQGHMDNMIEVFNALRVAINKVNTAITPAINKFLDLEYTITHGVSEFFNSVDYLGFNPFQQVLANLQNILHQVGIAFKTAFPDATLESVAFIIERINDFIAGLVVPWETLKALRDGFTGIFDVIDLIGSAVGTVLHILSPWLNVLNYLGALIVTVFGEIGQVIHAFKGEVEDSDGLKSFADILYNISETIANFFVHALSIAISTIRVFDVAIKAAGEILSAVGVLVTELALVSFGLLLGTVALIPKPILDVGNALISAFVKIIDYVDLLVNSVISAFDTGGFLGALDMLLFGIKAIPSLLTAAFAPVSSLIHSLFIAQFGDAIEYVVGLKDKFLEFKEKLIESLPDSFQNIITKLSTLRQTVLNVFGLFGAILTHTFFDPFSKIFAEDGGVGAFIDEFVANILALPGRLGAAFENVGNLITGFFTTKLNAAQLVFDEFKHAFAENGLSGVFNLLQEKFTSFGQTVQSTFTTLKDTTIPFIINSISDALTQLGTKFPTLGKAFDFLKELKKNVSNAFKGVWDFLKKAAGTMYEAGKAAIEGLIQGFTDNSIIQAIFGAIRALVGSKEDGTGIIGFFANLVGWHSPWTIMIAAGAAALLGLAIGFRDSAAMQAIFGALTAVKDGIIALLTPILPALEGFWDRVKTTFTWQNITNGFSRALTFIQGFVTSAVQFISSVGLSAWNIIVLVKDTLVGLFSSLSSINIDTSKISGPFKIVLDGLQGIWGWITRIFGVIESAANGKFGEKVQTAVGLTLLMSIPIIVVTIQKAVNVANKFLIGLNNKIGIVTGSVKAIAYTIKGFVGAISMSIEMGGISKMLFGIGAVVASVGLVVHEVGKLNATQIENAKDILKWVGIFLTVVIVVAYAMAAFSKEGGTGFTAIFTKAEKSLKMSASSLVEAALVVLAFGAATLLLVHAIKSLVEIDLVGEIGQNLANTMMAIFSIFAMVGSLALATAVIAAASPKIASGAITILATALALQMMVNAFKKMLGIVSAVSKWKNGKEIFGNAVFLLLTILAFIAAISFAAGKMGLAGGLGLAAMLYAFTMLDEIFTAMINTGKHIQDTANTIGWLELLKQLGSVMVLVGVFFATTRAAGKNALGAGVALLAITIALKTILPLFTTLLSQMMRTNDKALTKSLISMVAIIAVLGDVLDNCKNIGIRNAIAVVGVTAAISGLLLVVTGLTAIMTAVAHLDSSAFTKAAAAMIAFGLVIAAMVYAASFTEKAKPSAIWAMTISVVSIMSGLSVLSVIGDTAKIITTLVGIAFVFKQLSNVFSAAAKIKGWKQVFAIGTATLALISTAFALMVLSQFDWEKLAAAGGSIAVVIWSLAKALTIISKSGVNWADAGQLVLASVALIPAGIALTILSNFDWQHMLTAAGGLIAVVFALARVLKVLDNVKTDWKQIGQLVVLAGSLCLVALALVPLSNTPIEGIMSAFGAVALLFGELVGISYILQKITVSPAIWEVIGLAACVCAIALALTPLASMPVGQIWSAFGAVALLIGGITLIAGLLGTGVGAAVGAGALVIQALGVALIEIAAAVLIFAVAANMFVDAAQKIHDSGMSLEEVGETIKVVSAAIGEGIVTGLIQGLINGVGLIGDALLQLKVQVWDNGIMKLFPEDFDFGEWAKLKFLSFVTWLTSTEEGTILGSVINLGTLFAEKIRNLFPEDFDLGIWIQEKFYSFIAWLTGTEEGTILGTLEGIRTRISEFFTNLFPEGIDLLGSLKLLIQPIIDFISGTGEGSLLGSFDGVGENCINKLKEGFDTGITTLSGVGDSIKKAIVGENGEGGLWGLATDLYDGAVDGIKGFAEGLTSAESQSELQTAYDTAIGTHESPGWWWQFFNDGTGYGSPWQSMIQAGVAALEGLAEGMDDGAAKASIQKAAEDLAKLATGTLADSLETGLTQVGSAWSNGVATIMNAADAYKEGGVGGLIDSIPVLKNAKESVKKIVDEVKKSFQGATDALNDYSGGAGGAGKASSGAAKSAKEAAEEALRHEKAVRLQNEAVEEFVRVYGMCFDSLEDTTGATEIAKTAIEDLARTFGLTEDQVADTEAEIEDLFMDMYDTIHDSVDGSMKLFERFSSEMSIDPEAMLRNMRSNFTGISEWAEEVQMLAAKGFSKGLVEDLVKEGPSAQAKVRTFLKMTFGQVLEANDLYAKKAEATAEASLKAITAMAFAGKNQEEFYREAALLNAAPSLDEANKYFKDEVESFSKLGVDIGKAVFGNIDLNNRQVLELTEETIEQYHDILADWMDPEDLKNSVGSVATVLGGSDWFGDEENGLEIAFSPILQTENGPQVLSRSTIDKYINGVLDKARTELNEFSDEDLLRIDAEGFEVDGIKVKNIIADIGDTAVTTGEAMHYLGTDGSIAKGMQDIAAASKKAYMEAANHMQKVVVTYRELRDTIADVVESQIDLFSEFDKKTETSADQMLSNMASQIDGVQDWANGLEVLAQRGIDDGLLLKLKELGPKGYDQVNAFVQMTAEQLQQANNYYQQSLILPDRVSTQVSTSYLNTGLSVAQSMIGGMTQGITESQQQGYTALQQTAQNIVTQTQTDVANGVIDAKGVGTEIDTQIANGETENSETTVIPASEEVVAEGAAAAEEVATDAMANAGYNMVAGMVNAMLSAEALSSVRGAAVSLAMAANDTYTGFQQIESPSKVWGGFGLYQVLGLANSMYDNAGIASDAATYLADNANTALQQALNQMNADGLDNGLQPTITPVLDLTDIQNGMGVMNGLLNSQTYAVNGIANIDPASIMNQSFAMLNDVINRLSMAQSQPSVGDINVVVNAQGIDDPNLLADVVAQRIYTEILSREAVVY